MALQEFPFMRPSKLASLTRTGSAPITEMKAPQDSVIDLGSGATCKVLERGSRCSVGIRDEGIGKSKPDVSGPVKFTLSNTAHNLNP
jgi:hypothetical protein